MHSHTTALVRKCIIKENAIDIRNNCWNNICKILIKNCNRSAIPIHLPHIFLSWELLGDEIFLRKWSWKMRMATFSPHWCQFIKDLKKGGEISIYGATSSILQNTSRVLMSAHKKHAGNINFAFITSIKVPYWFKLLLF